jgi:glutathione peroxidase
MNTAQNIYQFTVKNAKGEDVSLANYKDHVILAVNVASKCGFTPQYKELQELYTQYKEQKFIILGFPCNQFGKQEPGADSEIQQFCELNFGVTFPVMAKIDVNGENADPLFKYLTSSLPGLLGIEMVKWNFTKFLIDKNGVPKKRYAPQDNPLKIAEDLKELL